MPPPCTALSPPGSERVSVSASASASASVSVSLALISLSLFLLSLALSHPISFCLSLSLYLPGNAKETTTFRCDAGCGLLRLNSCSTSINHVNAALGTSFTCSYRPTESRSGADGLYALKNCIDATVVALNGAAQTGFRCNGRYKEVGGCNEDNVTKLNQWFAEGTVMGRFRARETKKNSSVCLL